MSGFHTTHWTAVLAAKEPGPEKLQQARLLCETYYQPVLNFIRRTVAVSPFQYGSQDAGDLTHDFFIRVMQGKEFRHLERNHGRFRSYLLGAVKYFLADVREKASAQKRGGRRQPVSLAMLPETDIASAAESDARFDRDWAESLVSRAVNELRLEADRNGTDGQFNVLRHWLVGDSKESGREESAAVLGITKEHFKVQVSRLRKKFRLLIHREIAVTVDSESSITAELDYLILALR
jgi:RNA polymerase sigma-70 factor (ECF subfamily)